LKNKFYIEVDDLEALALGATLLGSGGGGDPQPDFLRTKELVERFSPVNLIDVEMLDDEALVVPIGFVGAPLVSIEKLPSGRECQTILQMVEKYFDRRVSALVAAEIGGSNAFVPLALAAVTSLPVLDADTLGRAFPELHMSACALAGISASPAFVADSVGNTAIVTANSPKKVEQMCRALTEAMGSSVAAAIYVLTGKEAKKALIPGTVTQALEIGRAIQQAQKKGDVVSVLCDQFQAQSVGHGIITDIHQDIQGGFLRGNIVISWRQERYIVDFQNEYLVVKQGERICCSTPDIIAIIDSESGTPLPVERLKYGLAVDLLVFPSPAVWKSEAGMKIVGPQAFGYSEIVV
jgi:DUF917 family protein